MQADWILPENKRLEVTLKTLNSQSHLLVGIDYSLSLSLFDKMLSLLTVFLFNSR